MHKKSLEAAAHFERVENDDEVDEDNPYLADKCNQSAATAAAEEAALGLASARQKRWNKEDFVKRQNPLAVVAMNNWLDNLAAEGISKS